MHAPDLQKAASFDRNHIKMALGIRTTLTGLALAATALAGCKVGPDYHTPDRPMPGAWGETQTIEPATRPTTTSSKSSTPTSVIDARGPGDLMDWWKRFNDPILNDLIANALKSNLTLQTAQERIVQARAQRRITRSQLFPQVDATGSYRRVRNSTGSFNSVNTGTGSGTSTTHTSGTVISSSGGRSSAAGRSFDSFQAGFDASWEIDIFGGTRRAVEAADYNIQAAIEDRRDVEVTLIAEVARTYIDLRGFQQEIKIAYDNLQAQNTTLELTRAKLRAGAATELDASQGEANVATTASTIPTLQIEARRSLHALAVLLGQDPMTLSNRLGDPRPIPPVPLSIPVGLPAELLRQRPDIRRSERQLAAATAQIGVATAELYPAFSLTGSLGLASAQFKSFGNAGSRFWSIGPSVSWPIFDAGRIRGNINVQSSLQRQALLSYQQTVLTALQETEDALTAYEQEQARRQTLWQAVQANARAAKLARQLYEAGRGDFLTVLDAERQLYNVQDQMVQSDRAVSENLVALYKALGGGWQDEYFHPVPVPPEQSLIVR